MTLLQELKDLFDTGKWASLEETLKHKLAEEQAKQEVTTVPTTVEFTAKSGEAVSFKALKTVSDAGDVQDAGAEAGYPFIAGRTYRIHFKNGNSGEYEGGALAHSFPFSVDQVESVDMIPLAGVLTAAEDAALRE